VERQELSGGINTVVRSCPIRREFLTVTGDWKTTRNGLAFSALLAASSIFIIHSLDLSVVWIVPE